MLEFTYGYYDKELQASGTHFVEVSVSEQVDYETNIQWDNKGAC